MKNKTIPDSQFGFFAGYFGANEHFNGDHEIKVRNRGDILEIEIDGKESKYSKSEMRKQLDDFMLSSGL